MKRRFAIIIILILTMGLFGCKDNSPAPETDPTGSSAAISGKTISEFKFVYGAPAYSIEYQVSFSDPATVFIKESMPTKEPFGPVPGYYQGTFDLDAEDALKVMKLYDKYELSKWNGFDEKSTLTDGGGFKLTITFQNGDVQKAEGYAKFPDGYSEFYDELEEIFQPYFDQIRAENEAPTSSVAINSTEEVPPASDSEKEAAEAARIQADDEIIGELDIASQTLLMDPEFFAAAEDKVVVMVSHVGVPAVSGLGEKGEDFLKELNLIVYGQEDPLTLFQSKGYTRSGSTKMEYTYNKQAFTWQSSVTNEIPGSRYYAAGSGDGQGTSSGTEVEVDADTKVEIDEAHFPDRIFREFVAKHIDADKNGVLDATEIRNTTVIDLENDPKGEDADCIHSLQGIGYFVALEKLYSCYNRLDELDLSENKNLQVLHCTNNGLKALNVSGCKELNRILCYDNSLAELDIRENVKLEELFCQRNALTALDIRENAELRQLNCAHNELSELDISNNPKLDLYIRDPEVNLIGRN